MKKLNYLFIYLLIAVQMFAGCSFGVRPASSEVSQTEESIEAINARYKDKAVIIDSVVDVFKEAEINSERITQGLFNQPVTVLENKDAWTKVKTVDGSTGWLRTKFIDNDCTSVKKELYSERIVITGKKKQVFTNYGGGATLKDVTMGTEFFVKSKKKNYYEVIVPGKQTGWIEMKNTILVPTDKPIPKTSADDFAATVAKFKDTQYLMGGVSDIQGIDCSGIVYICARINGVELPRGISEQFEFIKEGPESFEEVKVGDLVYFSANEDKSGVSEVGVCIGEGKYIYASRVKGAVVETALDSEYYVKRLMGIKRIF